MIRVLNVEMIRYIGNVCDELYGQVLEAFRASRGTVRRTKRRCVRVCPPFTTSRLM
jgi:hypothetical protein